jgi:hypothetical protein
VEWQRKRGAILPTFVGEVEMYVPTQQTTKITQKHA